MKKYFMAAIALLFTVSSMAQDAEYLDLEPEIFIQESHEIFIARMQVNGKLDDLNLSNIEIKGDTAKEYDDFKVNGRGIIASEETVAAWYLVELELVNDGIDEGNESFYMIVEAEGRIYRQKVTILDE